MISKDEIISRLLEQVQIFTEQNKNLQVRIAELKEKIARLKKMFMSKVLRPPNHHEAHKIKKRFTRKDKLTSSCSH